MIRHLTRPLWKAKQTQCVVTPSKFRPESPFHCVSWLTTPALGCFTVCTYHCQRTQAWADYIGFAGHIEWHLEAGLAVTFIEAPLEMQQRAQSALSPPTALTQQCVALNVPVSGNAAGHASATDLSGLQLGPYPQNNGWHTKGILAMTGCVLTAVIGMITVVWYAMGGSLSDEEIEREVRAAHAAKMKRGRLFGLLKRQQQ